MRLTIIDPDPTSDEPLVIEYRHHDGAILSAPVSDLLGEPHRVDVDEAGNSVAAVAVP